MTRGHPIWVGVLGVLLGQAGLVPSEGRAAEGEGAPGATTRVRPGGSPATQAAGAPSARQKRALGELMGEALVYEKLAHDFERATSHTIRHHYEERRRRVLSALDQEIGVEKRAFAQAREQAIERLEDFVERYSGANADPKATPDAMFRLAALYEERARAELDANLVVGLGLAVELYRRIIAEYPGYEERAAVHYYLAHALTDAGRLEEGQQAFRALVCQNHYQVADDPVSAARIAVAPLVQDHDRKYWDDWAEQHPVPLDQTAPKRRRGRASLIERAEELVFLDPYAKCQPIAQNVSSGDEPRYLAEAWWQLGNYHFDQVDPSGGPYSLNRAVSAYEHGLEYKKPPIYGVTLYKLAWSFFKQGRYRAATEGFVRLLRYADEQEARTGESGADFRAEATTYIASALTYRDFEGPDAKDPHIPRSDVLDLETDPLVIEQKMGVALERVKNPTLIDQDRKWSVEIYKALAQEYIDMSQYHNAIAALQMALARYGLDRDAPLMQNKVGELYERLARLSPEGSMARSEATRKTLEARGALAVFVGETPWTEANRDDPVALERAELLVRGGLMRAAADHTNLARGHYERALELNEPRERRDLLEKARAEYLLADQGWTAYLEQDPTAADAYDTRFWVADARVWAVLIGLEMRENPSLDEVRQARDAARAVRDSNEDDKYLQPAAYYLVNLAEKVLEGQYHRFRVTGGAEGLEAYDSVRFEGEGEERRVKVVPLPDLVLHAVQAREEYVKSVPAERDPFKNGLLYRFQAADLFFVYGQFTEARRRFRPLFEENCGKNEWGYKAWEKLISMSNFEGRVDESRALVEGRSCAYDAETLAQEESIRKPVRQGVAYLDARRLYESAEQLAEGPARTARWREAAAAYKVALDAAPDRDEAPEAAMNGAFAYKQIGDYKKAIGMYELFISRYGSEASLLFLRDGGQKGKVRVEPDPRRYAERVGYLKGAFDALGAATVLFFDYPRAAEIYEKIGENSHFSEADRRAALRQALILYSSLGDRGGMVRVEARTRALGASPAEAAEAQYLRATADLKGWDEYSPDEGGNREARRRAERAMLDFYEGARGREASAQFVVQAAYHVAKMKRASGATDADLWWKNTVEAFARYRRGAPAVEGRSAVLGSREAAMAAEAEYTMLDREIAKSFDYDTGHHRYRGTSVEVIRQYRRDAEQAKRWFDRLQAVIDAYLSPEWTPVLVARQGSLYDSLRTGLYNTRPPALSIVDKKLDALLKRAEQSGIRELEEQADARRLALFEAWRTTRDAELGSADAVVVDRYATALLLAQRYNASNPWLTRAIRRLAFLGEVVGEEAMAAYASRVPDLTYQSGMFQRMRPGLLVLPKSDPLPLPVPEVAP